MTLRTTLLAVAAAAFVFTGGGCANNKLTAERDSLATQNKELADQLKAEGITVSVVDAYSVKPLGKDVILAAARKTGNTIVTIEDHYPEGGIGDAVAGELSSEGIKVHKLAVYGLPRSGKAEELMAHFKIDAAAIVAKVKSL